MDRTRWGLVALIFIAALLAAAQFGKIALTLPVLAAAFGRSVPEVSVLVSLVGIMGLLLGVMAGGIAAAFGPGRTFLAGLLIGGALSLVQSLLPPFGLFAVTRGVEGLAHLALVVAGPPLMAAAATDRTRPLIMGLWALFFGASLAVSSKLFPVILAAGGLPLLFALHGGAMLALAAALWRAVPRVPRKVLSLNPVAVHRETYGRLRLMAPGLGFVCYTFSFIAAIAVLPPALDRPGLALSLPLMTLMTTLAGGALCRRFAAHRVAAVGYLGTTLGLVAEAFGLRLGIETAFAFMGLIPGASFAAIPALNTSPGDRARATGAIAQLGNLGTVTGTPVLAALWVVAGAEAVIWALAGVGLLGGALAFWSGARAVRTPEPVSAR